MFNLPDKVYDFLSKFQRWLPALGVAYLGLSEVWGLPFADHISKTIAVAVTLLASYLEICTVDYEKKQHNTGEDIGEYIPNEDIVEHEVDEGNG